MHVILNWFALMGIFALVTAFVFWYVVVSPENPSVTAQTGRMNVQKHQFEKYQPAAVLVVFAIAYIVMWGTGVDSERHGEQGAISKPSLEKTIEAMIVRDSDGTIRYWSKEAEHMYGWTSQEVLGKRSHTLFHTKFPASLATIEHDVRTHKTWRGQLVHRRRDGSIVIVKSHWDLQRNPENKVVTVIEINEEKLS